jgi:hypothetical protein
VAGPYDLLGSTSGSEAMQTMTRQDQLEDIVGNLGQTFLGFTIQCARCHDHKFDPIPQKEYFQIASAVAGVWPGERDTGSETSGAGAQNEREELARKIKNLRSGLDALEGPIRHKIEKDLEGDQGAEPGARGQRRGEAPGNRRGRRNGISQ